MAAAAALEQVFEWLGESLLAHSSSLETTLTEAQQVENTASLSDVVPAQVHTCDGGTEQTVEVARAWNMLLVHTVLCDALERVFASLGVSTWEWR